MRFAEEILQKGIVKTKYNSERVKAEEDGGGAVHEGKIGKVEFPRRSCSTTSMIYITLELECRIHVKIPLVW